MSLLVIGLVIFLLPHSVRVFADDWRTAQIARLGPMAWKGAYSLLSLAGFVLIVLGYGQARMDPVALWTPNVGLRHAASLLTLLSFVLLAAAYVPRNAIKAKLHHPMTLAVKTWALAHLLANHTLADVLLFGGFLLWSVAVFRAARARDRASAVVYPPGNVTGTALAVIAGLLAWGVFAFWLHAVLVGVRPFG